MLSRHFRYGTSEPAVHVERTLLPGFPYLITIVFFFWFSRILDGKPLTFIYYNKHTILPTTLWESPFSSYEDLVLNTGSDFREGADQCDPSPVETAGGSQQAYRQNFGRA